jgi:transcriptional regulator with XRE-family HTH domain
VIRRTRLAYVMTAYRSRRALSQAELAERMQASKRVLEEWEAGRRVPRPLYLRAWAAALELTDDEFAEVAALAESLRRRRRRDRRKAAA